MKISKHFTSSGLTKGFWLALLGSEWLYGALLGLDWRPLNTAVGLLFFYYLLSASRPVWFWSGFFIGILWFWWIGVSFFHYHMAWAIPIVVPAVGLVYGGIFWSVAAMADWGAKGINPNTDTVTKELWTSTPFGWTLKGATLLGLSYVHPLGFDWFKPELIFVHSYLGVAKWELAIILVSVILAHRRKQPLWLALSILAYSPTHVQTLLEDPTHTVKLIATHITIADKWNRDKIPDHVHHAIDAIDAALEKHYKTVILPESVFPFFLNREPKILDQLITRSQRINIIIGALYWDHGTHRNSTYFFHQGHDTVANKVVLVPFGESNPLPRWASQWVNKIFFDGSIDYTAAPEPTDWNLHGKKYRNAICYEATSERLYADRPRRMIVTSNNAWFIPSVEPMFQRLLLSYYVRKYGTTIYHATNMSTPYILRRAHP